MSDAYTVHMTDRTEEDYIMPTPAPDSYPQHPLGPMITIRIISPNSDPLSSTEFDTTWETIRIRASFSKIMVGGQTYWWEGKQICLSPGESPNEIRLKHGHTVRVVLCKEPEAAADVPDVDFEKTETDVL